MKKAAWVIVPTVLWVLGAGCQDGHQSAQVRIELNVFEIPATVLRKYTLGTRMYDLPDSSYALNVVPAQALANMLAGGDANSRMLYGRARVIKDWPRVADSWSYSRAYDTVDPRHACSGGGAGFLGVRERDGRLEVRIDYIVNHRGPQGRKAVESKIFYKCYYPDNAVLLFHAPSDLSDLRPQHHVIAFEAAREDIAPFQNGFFSDRDQPNAAQFR